MGIIITGINLFFNDFIIMILYNYNSNVIKESVNPVNNNEHYLKVTTTLVIGSPTTLHPL